MTVGQDVECTMVPQVMGQNQTSCQSFVGVWTDMVLDQKNVSTGTSTIFDTVGATASTATHIVYERAGWCMSAYPIGASSPDAVLELMGIQYASPGTWTSNPCRRFVPDTQVKLDQAKSLFAVMQAVGETFIFGDITSLVYDHPSDNLFFIVTTYEVNGPPGSNSASTLTNRRDEILAMQMKPCIESPITGCRRYRVIDKSVWQAKYGGDGTKRLNEFGQKNRSITDISIVHYDDPGSTYIVMAQVSMLMSARSCQLAHVSSLMSARSCQLAHADVVYDKRAHVDVVYDKRTHAC
jgi:hypothetical protein